MGPPGEPAAGRRPRWLAASPRAVALRLLAARFGPAAGGEDPAPEAGAGSGPAGPRPVFDLADFQADAVWRASEILARRRGVLIADSVGLGKTYVALALAERELRRGGRVAVVTPAALRRDWVPALRRLADGLGVRQTSGLGVWRKTAESVLTDGPATTCADHALPVPPAPGGRTAAGGRSAARSRSAPGGRTAAGSRPAGAGGPRPSAAAAARARGDPGARPPPLLAWLSHARLSRGTHRPERLVPLDLVVVDEAHAFRSPRTRRYRALAALCRGSRVVLLTATPVNNAASDLYHQLRLFAGDGDFRDIGVADLGAVFRAVTEDAAAARSALAVLRQVMIRRTRPFLREHYAGVRLPGRGGKARVLAFPERAPPRPIRYSLQAAYPGLLDDIAETLAALILAPYAPGEYGADGEPAARGVAELLRLALLKRLESSVAAFRASIARLVRYYEACDGALAAGWLLAPAEHRRLLEIRGDGDVVQLVFPELALRPAPAGLDVARMRADVRAELDALQALERALAGIDPSSDPKLAALLELLEGEARGSKVVVFTEFRDTARHLWRALVRRGGVALVDGGGAFLGLNPCGRRQAIERFAPRSNGAREPAPRERVDLLIATDVLSEGLNLQDANRVVSYDLPWNPVRLIQRVGRVDRLGSPHPVVYSDHFLPDRGLEPLLGLVARLRAKLLAIGRTVGGEGAVLEPASGVAEDLRGFVDRLAAGDPGVLEEAERRDAAALEVEERLRALHRRWARAAVQPGERLKARGGGSGATALPRQPGGGAEGDAASEGRWSAGVPLAARLPSSIIAGRGSRVLLGYRLGGEALWIVVDPARRTAMLDDVAAAELLEAALEGAGDAHQGTDPLEAPGGPRDPTRDAPAEGAPLGPDPGVVGRALAAARPVLAARRAAVEAGAAAGAAPRSVAARAARRVQAVLAAIPGGPDAATCARADAVLAALGQRLDAGAEAAVRAVLARCGGHAVLARHGGRAAASGNAGPGRHRSRGRGVAGPPGAAAGPGEAAAEALALLGALETAVGAPADLGARGARPAPAGGEPRRRRAVRRRASARPVLIGILEVAAAGG